MPVNCKPSHIYKGVLAKELSPSDTKKTYTIVSECCTSFDAGLRKAIGLSPIMHLFTFHKVINQKCRVKTSLSFQSRNSVLLTTSPQVMPWLSLQETGCTLAMINTHKDIFRLSIVAKITPSQETFLFLKSQLTTSNV